MVFDDPDVIVMRNGDKYRVSSENGQENRWGMVGVLTIRKK